MVTQPMATKQTIQTHSLAYNRPIVTKVAGKFQITVPAEIRAIFDLQEGDLFEWSFDRETQQLTLVPKRAQLITPRLRDHVSQLQAQRGVAKSEKAAEVALAVSHK